MCGLSEPRLHRSRSGFGWLARAVVVGATGTSVVLAAGLRDRIVTNLTAKVTSTQGRVEYTHAAEPPIPARHNQVLNSGDRLTTFERADASVLLQDTRRLWLREWTQIRCVEQPGLMASRRTPRSSVARASSPAPVTPPGAIHLSQGEVYYSSGSRPGSISVTTPAGDGVPEGTEFTVRVDPDLGRAVFTMLDGKVVLANEHGTTNVTSGWYGVLQTNQAPQAFRIEARKLVQWWLYYPAVLDPDELASSLRAATSLEPSLAAYRAGDLGEALAKYPGYPSPAAPTHDSQRAWLASLLLGSGAVEEAIELLGTGDADHPHLLAVNTLLAAVTTRPALSDRPPGEMTRPVAAHLPDNSGSWTASQWLAQSYERQANYDLAGALACARRAIERSPQFAYGWARVAELEFSHGRTREARRGVEKALEFGPRNAQAHAIHGFLLAAQNDISEALAVFERVVELDPGLANGWLGRGLCRIRQGQLAAGRQDLETAVSVEPGRSLLRSYAAKALLDEGWSEVAVKELRYAVKLDPLDPTPWLYSALAKQEANRLNEAATDLEQSLSLNENRTVYRSDLLLDQDRAVRGANLANIYADAGMSEVSVREATRGLNSDYANAAAHLFLANSYNALRDPRQVNLRHEAAWFSEFLLANLLSPVGAGTLSQTVSQGEYSKLFERDQFGVVSETLWTSNGDWLESGTQFGRFGNFEYALDAPYRSEVGQRPNNDLEQLTLSFQGKAQLGLADTVFLQGIYYDAESGDVAQHYDPAKSNPGLRLHETQEPIVIAGWNHQWKPGVHTLLLVSPWKVEGRLSDPRYRNPVGFVSTDGSIDILDPVFFGVQPLDYHTRYAGWSAELQHLWQIRSHTLIGGLRYQSGEFDTDTAMDVRSILEVGPIAGVPDESTVLKNQVSPRMERFSLYGYDQWQVLPWALVSAGVSYDRLIEPLNFTQPPLTDQETTVEQVSPKVGLTLTPWKGGAVRGAFTRSLGGVSFDQSYRLEPVQVAGFTQTYRGLMPESLVGLVPGQEIETWGVGLEQNFGTRTYLTINGEQVRSDAERGAGAFLAYSGNAAIIPSTLTEALAFQERGVRGTLNQLVGEYLTLGAAYRISEAELDTAYAGVEDSPVHRRSVLQQLDLSARFNHPSGIFARWDSIWNHQSNYEDAAEPRYGGGPGDDFWQHNLWVGWRFHRRHAEVAVGILNLTDQDYRLHPLNYYPETYRDRTYAASLRFNF